MYIPLHKEFHMQKIIPIFFSFDNNYVIPASVAFASLLTNTNDNIFYNMYVLHTDITAANQDILQKQVATYGNGNLLFVNVSEYFKDQTFDQKQFAHISGGSTFTIETLYRCLAVNIPEFKNIDKIIYSDVDICVTKDISALFDINIEKSYLAACKTPEFLEFQIDQIPLQYRQHYFAGGLWILNFKKIREDNLDKKIYDIAKNPPFFMKYPDQDIMCLACKDKVTYFSHDYISVPDRLSLLKKLNFCDKYYPNNELYDAAYNPKIIHYAGIKPWKQNCAGSELWFYWLSKTPFAKYKEELTPKCKISYKLYLFGFIPIPFIKILENLHKIKINLFKIIPILKIKKELKYE